jgi:hypothetical protein
MTDEEEPGDPYQPEIIIEPQQLTGVWANFARVTHSDHELTLDFVRMDYAEGSPSRRESWWRVSGSPPCSSCN